MANASRVTAVLGPTNTGKTHYAIDRMLGYRTGIMGFPLRLLAREVYDKIVAARGPSVVALLTGEERIVPPRAQYWICTVEAMPEGMGCDFLAIDEIQLCADPERGHVFTDRLLRARGTHETLFLGADTMRGPIQALVPGVEFVRRERMSDLVYAGSKKISRMPPRTAIVGFSVDNVYAIAELIRRQKGGAAVVMGALSPRTRNAQVALYQNGEVDYLVATDAIGMGLNLDIDHVAFASTSKFDGRRMRPLAANELAQIAGRAGRGMSHGSFGVTGDARPLDEGTAQAIMEHRFTPLKKLNWRSSALQFGTVEALIRSLEAAPQDEFLMKAREADDLGALKALSQDPDILARTTNAPSVRLLWDVCRIPDFRGISHAEHASLLRGIFNHLHGGGVVPDDWLARQIKRIDRTDGNIDALSKRLAFIRTWTYVAQRKGWLRDEIHWRNETRAVEDRLSDALHERLTEKFVDRRTSVLLRRLKQKEALLAEVNDKGEVTVEGEFVGRLEGFRFSPDKGAEGAEAKALKSASLQALAPHFHLRADRFYNAPDTEIDFTEQGGLMWGDSAIGKLVAGADPLTPGVQVFVDDAAGTEVAQKVERRLQHFISRKVQSLFEPLLNLQKDEELNGLARGFAFRMVEALGLLPRHTVAQEVKDLDQDARGALRKHGVRFGQFTIFMPLLLKPAPTRLRLVLWSLANGLQDFPEAPPPGLVTVPALKDAPQGYDTMSGYREAGERMIRIDMLERLADMLRAEDSRGGFEAKPDMLSITGMTLEQFADLMQGLGYRAEKGEREKVKPADAVVAETGTPAAGQPVMDAAADAENTPAATPAGEGAAPAADVVPEAAAIADEGVAPIAETGSDAAAEEPVPEVAENETPVGEAADASVEAPEVEVFYTFTWGGRARQGGNRGQRRGQQGQDARGNAGGGKGKPRGAKGGAGGGKPGGKKGGRPQQQGGKTYSARPPKKEKKIDPDNPFAAALMGLKQGD
ncbi:MULTISPECIES: helicase-related protein [Rhodobacterales]|uniref:helicase-related protein n=1 Tax=Rhodobacterales TaxID=204455 RepID=UPI00237EF84C|nr:helicase-related protein [Phaeobacter gallaeciensis]MDE4140938.1 helicase-related protein [Phaeobacter gallaeciensis]MDE4149383.1 helicase-related protein [Phaeobacter gallaeciensis]MDE4153424.1 helicase-related protein [Phaeobacter gallaeciensis]MDE4228813.1 helicase-related protein [Phaeobacter gallaeciensis]MDE4257888.1 helicase-related protein [Phaeobacter gallaeciensis]